MSSIIIYLFFRACMLNALEVGKRHRKKNDDNNKIIENESISGLITKHSNILVVDSIDK